jgi:predicted negative regulator of RcsB-dependent stress response
MAALDLEEQEQLAQIKAWWQRYGNHVLTAITVVFLVIAGYNGWSYYQRSQSVAVAQVFEGLQKLAAGGDARKVGEASKALAEQYPRSTLAVMGNLIAARVSFEANDLAAARTQLQWVVNSGRDEALKHVARIRLAGIMLDQKQFDDGLKQLEAPHPAEFDAQYGDRRGDILFAMGKLSEAREAWQKALGAGGATATLKAALEFKLEMAGVAPAVTKS